MYILYTFLERNHITMYNMLVYNYYILLLLVAKVKHLRYFYNQNYNYIKNMFL